MSVDGKEVVDELIECVETSEDISSSIRYGLSKLKLNDKLKKTEGNLKKGLHTLRKGPHQYEVPNLFKIQRV